jgi:hypothetical protein
MTNAAQPSNLPMLIGEMLALLQRYRLKADDVTLELGDDVWEILMKGLIAGQNASARDAILTAEVLRVYGLHVRRRGAPPPKEPEKPKTTRLWESFG